MSPTPLLIDPFLVFFFYLGAALAIAFESPSRMLASALSGRTRIKGREHDVATVSVAVLTPAPHVSTPTRLQLLPN